MNSPTTQFISALQGLVPQTTLETRNEISQLIKACLNLAREEAETKLLADGQGTKCAEYLSTTEDAIIQNVISYANTHVFPGQDQLRLSVVAVGGFGRGTLAPGSDIDLLFLMSSAASPRSLKIVEFLLYALWDARQKVGHATRSIDDCIKLAKSDNTILTSILEARYICQQRGNRGGGRADP